MRKIGSYEDKFQDFRGENRLPHMLNKLPQERDLGTKILIIKIIFHFKRKVNIKQLMVIERKLKHRSINVE